MSLRPRHLLALTALTLATCAAPARAVWGPDSVLTLGRTLSCGVINARIYPGPAATLDVVWHGGSCTGNHFNGAARVTRDGGLVFSVPLDYGELPAVAPDGSGGLVAAAYVDTCYCSVRHIVFRDFDAAGHPDPSSPYEYYWADQGPGGFDMNPAAATDPAGGVYVAWLDDPYTMLQRLSSDGVVAPGWPKAGLPLTPGDIVSPGLMPDGSGGVYVLNLPQVYRVQSDGTPAPGWPLTGEAVTTNAASSLTVSYPADLGLVASESGHVFAVWLENSGSSNRVMVRSFDSAGTMDWAPVALTPYTASLGKPAAASDGQSGLLVSWFESGTYRVAHVLANGTSAGPIISRPTPPLAWWFGCSGAVAPARNGGFIMFWADSSGVWATWHLADGNLDPAESVNPRLVQVHDPSLHGATYPVAAVSDGDGGAYMAFDAGGYFDYPPPAVGMRHVFRSGVLDVGSTPHPPRLALAVSPNPARRELTLEIGLAGDAPASMELLDVSGRRLLSRALGPGSLTRREFVALPAGMAPGVYLVRLSQRGSATVRRFAVLD